MAGGVAAPLLAGFSLSALLAASMDRDHLRWPGVTTLVLACASVALITAVQCSFRARSHLWSPSDVHAWWPDLNAEREAQLQYEQAANYDRWNVWDAWQRRTYNAGITALFGATATALVPTNDSVQPAVRWIAAAVAAMACLGEIVWTLVDKRSHNHG
jgi:hypothetical protein